MLQKYAMNSCNYVGEEILLIRPLCFNTKKIHNIGSSLSMADTQFQTILTLLQGEATSIIFWIRPSSQGGSTDYGLGLLEEPVNYITDENGLAIF